MTPKAGTRRLAFIIEIVRVGRYTVSYNATLYKAAPTDFGKNLVGRSIARLEAAARLRTAAGAAAARAGVATAGALHDVAADVAEHDLAVTRSRDVRR